MGILDYFEQGRQQERDRSAKIQRRVRTSSGRKGKLPAYSPAMVLVGAGVLFEMAQPLIRLLRPIPEGYRLMYRNHLKPTVDVITTDIHMLIMRCRKVNPDWEAYKRFEDLARGKR